MTNVPGWDILIHNIHLSRRLKIYNGGCLSGFLLMYFIFLGNCCFVQGAIKQYSVCEDEDAKFKFDRVPDNNTLVAEWYKMGDNNVNRTCILKKHKIARPCIPYVGKASLSPTDNRLTIARIDRSETGLYLQELDNVNNGENRYQSYLQVTVLVPPSGLPHINATKSSDEKLILTCFEPEFKGIPEVLTQFQDSNGKPQNDLVVTVSDSMYKCCLLGDAVRCMGQHDDVCSIYIVKDIEKDTCIRCWISIYCFWVIPWLLSLLVQPLFHLIKRKKTQGPRKKICKGFFTSCNKKYEHMFTTIILFITSLVIVILLSVYFCQNTDDCNSVSLVSFVGFTASVAFVVLLFIIKMLTEILKKLKGLGPETRGIQPSAETENRNITHLSRNAQGQDQTNREERIPLVFTVRQSCGAETAMETGGSSDTGDTVNVATALAEGRQNIREDDPLLRSPNEIGKRKVPNPLNSAIEN